MNFGVIPIPENFNIKMSVQIATEATWAESKTFSITLIKEVLICCCGVREQRCKEMRLGMNVDFNAH